MIFDFLNVSIDNLPETYLENIFWEDPLLYQLSDEFTHAHHFLSVFVFVEVGVGWCDLDWKLFNEAFLEVGHKELL